MNKQRIFLIALIVLFLATILGEATISLLTDWWWFSAVGFKSIFIRVLGSRIMLFFIFAAIFLLFFSLNLHAVTRRGGGRWREFYSDLPIPGESLERFRRLIMIGISLLIATALGIWASQQWMTVLQAVNAQPFGTPDPLFGKDLGFYVFTLPLMIFLKQWALWTLAVTSAAVLLLYWESKALGMAYEKLYISPRVRLHLIFLASLLFLLLAWHFQLEIYNLLYSERGIVFGASYTDHHADILAFRIMIFISVLLFGAMVIGLWKKEVKIPLYAAGSYVVALVLVTALYPAAVQQFIVAPNEITKERPYIEYAIEFTRLGYGLDRVSEQDFPATLGLTLESLDEFSGTFQNIRLWDWRPLRQTYSQLQEIRLYYRFQNPDIDRYMVNGEYRQVMLAARELDSDRLALQAQTWINRHIKFTHGYGVAMSPVNEVTAEGMPVFFLKDIPPRSDWGLEVTRPEIYYGELTSDYVLVKTSEKEFDYVLGDTNAFTTYAGEGGVPIGGLLRRAAYAAKYGHFKLLISEYPTSETRLMENRTIRQRVQKIAPFLEYDHDPYLVVADGALFWILDAYTVSTRLPYSDPSAGGINYIRNSVKVVVDAYNGTVKFYLADPDPIANTLGEIFPGLFSPITEMPDSIREHIRFPLDLFELQAEKWQAFHMEDPEVFYNQEDLWSRPTEIYEGDLVQMEAYYVIMNMPGEEEPEFILMLPFTPSGKDNMVAWLAARCDPEHYGELFLFKFSKQELIYGPMQIEARFDQDPTISEQLTLWSQQGSSVIRGNLLVIPVGESLIYVEPLYLRAERSELPELKRVLLSYGPKVIMEETLQQGLQVLLGGEVTAAAQERVPITITRPGEEPETLLLPAEMAARALSIYREAQDHLRGSRWAQYGAAMDRLEQLLQQLNRNLRGGGGE